MNMEQLLQVEQLCAALRTDMDGFHDVEIEYLMWLGAVKIDYALRLLLPGNEQLQQSKMPKLPDYDAGFATAVLERGGKMSIFAAASRSAFKLRSGTYEEDFIFSDTFGCAGACSRRCY